MIRERQGNLITLAKEEHFDVITHGCNCFCTMGAGIAPQMAEAFGCDKFEMESYGYRGDINKLGCIDYEFNRQYNLQVVNSYTQYRYGRNHKDGDKTPVDYDAIRMCMRKINHSFPGKTIGLPLIGCGLAGGDWGVVKKIIEAELNSMDVWIVHYEE
jgi:O-acetyl-ADP-ribose deacetylase (regulator of RNase III)